MTPLALAAANGHRECVALLARAGQVEQMAPVRTDTDTDTYQVSPNDAFVRRWRMIELASRAAFAFSNGAVCTVLAFPLKIPG